MNQTKQNALVRILSALSKLSVKTTYYAASAGAIALLASGVDPATLPPAIGVLASGLGINLLSGMIDRIANDENLSEDDIAATMRYVLTESKLEEKLSDAEFRQVFTNFTGGWTLALIADLIQTGQSKIAERLLDQIDTMQNMELRLSNQLSSEFAALHRTLEKLKQQVAITPVPTGQPRQIRIFLSSPGDVAEERALALKVIDDLAHDPFLKKLVTLEALAWEKAKFPMYANFTPQVAINLGMAQPADCDIVVVIMWSRMGTPLPVEYVKPDGTRYLSGTEWEYFNALEAFERTRSHPKVLVYRRIAKVLLDQDDVDYDSKREQYQRLKNFFAAFYAPDGSILRGMSQHSTPAEFAEKLRDDLKAAIDHILRETAPTTSVTESNPATVQQSDGRDLWQGSPFPGLRAFQETDAPIFFGRERETEALLAMVQAQQFVAVVGASGSGKSSLVGAGLLPRLRQELDPLHIVSFKPGAGTDDHGVNPFAALYEGLTQTFPQLKSADPLESIEKRHKYAHELATKPQRFAEIVQQLAPDGELVVFVDQFEETFTLVPPTLRSLFIALLLYPAKRVRFVLTMRSDFQQRCLEDPQLAKALNAGEYKLAAPRLSALYSMITRPAERAGLRFDEGLAAQMLEDTGDEPGNLALLAYALDELYKIADVRHDRRLAFADYAALEGVQGAIGKRAEQVFAQLALPDKEMVLHHVFRELVEVDSDGKATRRRQQLTHFGTDEQTLIAAFQSARLLVTDHGLVEVAHEALFRSWQRLKDWIAEAQEDLILLRQVRTAAHDWQTKREREPGKDFDYLRWPAERLTLVYAMQDRLHPELNEVERDFIEPEQARLVRELETLPRDDSSHERRRDIGDRLAVIDDTRPGVGVKDGLPDIDWLPVTPGGEIVIEGQTFTVQPFYVAKYLITYAQFQVFVDAEDGFNDLRWWADMPNRFKRQELNNQRTKVKNAPRDSVSWYQAVAFARWMNHRLRGLELAHPSVGALKVGADAEIRLPTEWEWQWMAQGGIKMKTHPWGEWQQGYANTREVGLSRTTAVGMYLHGAADCGALDVAGNLFEWCLNDHEDPQIIDGYSNDNHKVLRGGSFNFSQLSAASSSRLNNNPYYGYSYYGLRLVCCPLIGVSDL